MSTCNTAKTRGGDPSERVGKAPGVVYSCGMLACPRCRSALALEAESETECPGCGERYHKDRYGYWVLTVDPKFKQLETTTADYACCQETAGVRVYGDFLKPIIERSGAKRILDVGCGQGAALASMLNDGLDAYGVDLPSLARYWDGTGNDRSRFIASSALELPFADDSFDLVFSFGVIEHIGTVSGHSTLAPGYEEQRQRYVSELLRVIRPGGQILLSCPNKRFPIDIQHGALDRDAKPTLMRRIRQFIYGKTGMNFHPVLGEYHLLSYGEVRKLAALTGRHTSFEPVPLKGYFGFGGFRQGYFRWIKDLVEFYVTWIPHSLRTSFLNPYLLVRLTK
jgi:SAM-dependent methyltransferase